MFELHRVATTEVNINSLAAATSGALPYESTKSTRVNDVVEDEEGTFPLLNKLVEKFKKLQDTIKTEQLQRECLRVSESI